MTKTTQNADITQTFEREVIDRLARIETKLDADYTALHGNGKPGLLDRVSKLENSMYAGGFLYRTSATKPQVTKSWPFLQIIPHFIPMPDFIGCN